MNNSTKFASSSQGHQDNLWNGGCREIRPLLNDKKNVLKQSKRFCCVHAAEGSSHIKHGPTMSDQDLEPPMILDFCLLEVLAPNPHRNVTSRELTGSSYSKAIIAGILCTPGTWSARLGLQ